MFLRSVSRTFTIVERRALCCASDPHRCSQWMWFSHRNIQKTDQPGPSTESDLATALHRLSLRRQNYLSEKQFFAEEWQRKIQVLADQKEEGSGCGTPTESLASLYTDQSETTDLSSASCLRGFMPEKLQIVKPLEGNKWGPFLSDVAYGFAFPWKWCVSCNCAGAIFIIPKSSLFIWPCTAEFCGKLMKRFAFSMPSAVSSLLQMLFLYKCGGRQVIFSCPLLRNILDSGAFQIALVEKNPLASAGDLRDVGSIPELGRPPEGGHSNPLQYSCLENPMDRGA